MNNSYDQSIEWLQSQGQVEQTVDSMKKMVNVQTGLIEKLRQDTLELETLMTAQRAEFEQFTHRIGLNYPK